MSQHETPTTAFILSLIAGILLLVSGILNSVWFMNGGYSSYNPGNGGMMGGSGMMNGYESMMNGFGMATGYMTGFSIISLIAGILVLIGAIMLNTRSADHVTWGAIIIAFSAISLLGMGGFFVGALIGIAGGALALAWRPRSKT